MPALFTTRVEPAEGVDRGLHDPARAFEVGDVVAVDDRIATHRLDVFDGLLRGRKVGALARRVAAEVVDDDLRALARERERMLAADPATRPGHDHDAALTNASHRFGLPL